MSRSELHFILSFQLLLLLSVVAGISRQILLSERRHEINAVFPSLTGRLMDQAASVGKDSPSSK